MASNIMGQRPVTSLLPSEGITVRPAGTTWAGSEVYSRPEVGISAHTRQGYWYRLREQREHGWRNEALCYWLQLSYYDDRGRLWRCAGLATCDDFGNLVEVDHA